MIADTAKRHFDNGEMLMSVAARVPELMDGADTMVDQLAVQAVQRILLDVAQAEFDLCRGELNALTEVAA